jgi:hypothetical protein
VARRTGRRDWFIACSLTLASNLPNSDLGYDEALSTLALVDDQDLPPQERAEAVLIRAELEAYRGDRTAWPRAIAEARALTAGSSNTQLEWEWATASAYVALAEGRLEDARREAEGIGGNWMTWRYVTQAHAAIRSREAAAAREAAGSPVLQLERGAIYEVDRLGFAAGIAALEGRRDEAVAGYHEAFRVARQLDLTAILADHLLTAVIALGPGDPETPALADEARSLWEPAGDRAHLDRLDEALAPGSTPRARTKPAVTTVGTEMREPV